MTHVDKMFASMGLVCVYTVIQYDQYSFHRPAYRLCMSSMLQCCYNRKWIWPTIIRVQMGLARLENVCPCSVFMKRREFREQHSRSRRSNNTTRQTIRCTHAGHRLINNRLHHRISHNRCFKPKANVQAHLIRNS